MPGAVAVLHTHSRELKFHPHIHIVMPGATMDKVSRLWSKKSGEYLFNHKALAKVFRAKLLQTFSEHHLKLPSHYPDKWGLIAAMWVKVIRRWFIWDGIYIAV